MEGDAMTECKRCGGTIELREYRHVTVIDGHEVGDSSQLISRCNACGHFRLTIGDVERYERRAAALVLRSLERASGPAARYARRALGVTQEQLAQLIGYASETISRVENGHLDVERSYQLSLVALLDTAVEFALDVDGLVGFMRSNVTTFEVPASAHFGIDVAPRGPAFTERSARRASANAFFSSADLGPASNDNGIISGVAFVPEKQAA
jgi:transcriptional regulator with XRE-family HTH domain